MKKDSLKKKKSIFQQVMRPKDWAMLGVLIVFFLFLFINHPGDY